MSRLEDDREDLFAEAAALIQRIELRRRTVALSEVDPVHSTLLGIRRDGALSLYLAPDDVWHFDAENRLRRAFHAASLYRAAENGRLARLDRVRTSTESILARTDLTEIEQYELLDALRGRLHTLLTQLRETELTPARHHPAEDDPQKQLGSIVPRIEAIAASPIQVAPPVR